MASCDEARPWSGAGGMLQLNLQGTMTTGGLGKLMITYEVESWVCMKDKSDCLADIASIASNTAHSSYGQLPEWAMQYTEVPAGDSMCYVYHEQQKRFLVWAPNSQLRLY